MSIYTDKMACLVSLIEQLKRYPFDDLLEVAHVEYILDMPEIAGRDWEKGRPLYQKSFLRFLNICIFTYKKTLKQLKEKGIEHTDNIPQFWRQYDLSTENGIIWNMSRQQLSVS